MWHLKPNLGSASTPLTYRLVLPDSDSCWNAALALRTDGVECSFAVDGENQAHPRYSFTHRWGSCTISGAQQLNKRLPQGMNCPGILMGSRAAKWYIYRHSVVVEGWMQATQQHRLKKATESSPDMRLYVRQLKFSTACNEMLTDSTVLRDHCSSCSCASAGTCPMQLQRSLYHRAESTLSHWVQQD